MKDILLVAGLLAAPLTTSIRDYRAKPAQNEKDPRLARLKEFFAIRGCPLKDAAKDFLVAADENSLDWRLLPSISIIESSGGKAYKNNNVFGWDSAKASFPVSPRGNPLCCGAAWKINQIQRQRCHPQVADLQSFAQLPRKGQSGNAGDRGEHTNPRRGRGLNCRLQAWFQQR